MLDNKILKYEDLLKILKVIFKNFLINDYQLIEMQNYELSFSGRLAIYFRDGFLNLEKENILVDIEYNKYDNGDKKRYVQNDNNTPCIRPDILLHERTTQDNNIIYCEIKKKDSEAGSDKRKVEEQVKDKKYIYGIYIYKFKKEKISFEIFHSNTWINYNYDLNENEIIRK